jgi:hypothetical protein
MVHIRREMITVATGLHLAADSYALTLRKESLKYQLFHDLFQFNDES